MRVGPAAIAFAGVVGLATAAQRRRERESGRLRPPGRMVDVDGMAMHVVDVGDGSPIVVLDAGAGGTLDSWARVQPRLAEHARVVAYDRPGLGFSEAAAAPDDRRPVVVAHRLHALLEGIDAAPPYLLVGHSLGGLHVRAFASAFPGDVCGLVLVDPSHEDMQRVLSTAPRSQRTAGAVVKAAVDVAVRLAPVGTGRLLVPLLVPRTAVAKLGLDPARVAAARARHQRADVLRTIWREQAEVDAALEQIRTLRVPASIPVTVLSGDRMNAKGTNQAMRDAMNELHARLAATSDSGRHVVVAESGHLVPIDQPGAVVDEVLTLVRAHRTG